MKTKSSFLMLWVVAASVQVLAQSRSPWEMNLGEGIVPFGFTSPIHGDSSEYGFATIPQPGDPNWTPAPDPDIIDFAQPSTLCGVIGCRQGADFTYFRTFVNIPSNIVVTRFTISTSGVDDGIRVTIFNSKFPSGKVVPGSYVFLGGSGTADLKDLVVSGEINTVIITHTDDCCSESYIRRVDVVLNGQTVRVLEVDVEITSPSDSSFVCQDSVLVTGKVRISSSEPLVSDSCEVNGVTAAVSDSIFTAMVPLLAGQNLLIAKCAVVDASGTTATDSDTIVVFSDPTPPEATFDFSQLPLITGEAVDEESGIATITVVETKNRVVFVDQFSPGDKRVRFRSERTQPQGRSSFTLRISNLAGCEILADPAYLRLEPVQTPARFTLPPTDRYLFINNHGLERILIRVNQHEISLTASTAGQDRNGNTYFMPFEGKRSIDLFEYLGAGENEFVVTAFGPEDASADFLITDFRVDETATGVVGGRRNDREVPATFTLAQNYPNPFNPETRILFEVPEGWNAPVTLRVFTMQGQFLQTLVDGLLPPGQHIAVWNARKAGGETLPSGVYFYQIRSGGFVAVRKMLLEK